MDEPDRKPLNYAPPPRRQRTRLRDLSFADWMTLLMAAMFASFVLLLAWQRVFRQ